MKILDMFGSGLAVCAKSFPALPELLVDGYNGRIFNTSQELEFQISDLFELLPDITEDKIIVPSDQYLEFYSDDEFVHIEPSHPADYLQTDSKLREIDKLKIGAKNMESWNNNWMNTMYPLVKEILNKPIPTPQLIFMRNASFIVFIYYILNKYFFHK
jgi:beta-1,4-mannosyltransferase